MEFKESKRILNEIFESGIDKDQTKFLRTIFFEYMNSDAGGNNNYSDFKREIIESFDVVIDSETLSSFCENENKRKPGEDYDSSAKTKKYIALALSRLGWLNSSELKAAKCLDAQAPIRLARYLWGECIDFDVNYIGVYEQNSETNSRKGFDRLLDISSGEGEAYFNVEALIRDTNINGHEFDPSLGIKTQNNIHNGWGVFLQKDMLLIVIRNLEEGNNYSYISIVEPKRISGSDRVMKMMLMEHCDLQSFDWKDYRSFKSSTANLIPKINVIEFQRKDIFSCKNMSKVSMVDEENNKIVSFRRRKLTKSSFLEKKRFSGQGELKKGNIMDDALGKQLIDAASVMDTEEIKILVNQDPDIVNYQVPSTGVRAYQIAAKCGDWDSFRVMVDTEKCDFLHRDNRGWLTSRFASSQGHMKACGAIMDMEKKQGKEVGIVPLVSGDMTTEDFVAKYGREYSSSEPE